MLSTEDPPWAKMLENWDAGTRTSSETSPCSPPCPLFWLQPSFQLFLPTETETPGRWGSAGRCVPSSDNEGSRSTSLQAGDMCFPLKPPRASCRLLLSPLCSTYGWHNCHRLPTHPTQCHHELLKEGARSSSAPCPLRAGDRSQ